MQKFTGKYPIFALALAIAACKPATETAAPAVSEGAPATQGCGVSGHLQTQLYGAIAAPIDWSAGDLTCEGMPRPDGAGARLRFAGSVDGHQIAIIVAMPEFTTASTGQELASNVTLIEEGSGRFFSTVDLDVCLTEVASMTSLDDASHQFTISGTVYCVSPLAEVNGESSISIPELRFAGLIDWDAS